MKRNVTGWAYLAILCLATAGYGMATEQIGPDKPDRPTMAESDWPKGIVEIPRHASRVYSIWVNGNENFYFKATSAEVNDLVTMFSKAHMRDHEVMIAVKRPDVKPIGGDAIDYNVRLQIVAGIALAIAREGQTDLPLEPRLTIFAGDDRALVEKVVWPKDLTVTSEVPGLSIPSPAAQQRAVYYAKCEFADGSPPEGFAGVHSRVTLWRQQAEDGIGIGRVDYKGYVRILLSKEEMADLRAGQSWLTVTIANAMVEARKTDQRLPADSLTPDKDQAKAVKVQGIPYYYGRLLFEDGSPAVLDQETSPGALLTVDFPYAGMVVFESDGYFKVALTKEQFEKAVQDKPRKNIYTPDPVRKGSSTATATFPVNLLSQDKAKAGVVKIPRPVLPKTELVDAQSKIGKPAPGFDKIKFEAFQPEQAKDKPLIVCFWDFDQRSSRQCVEALQKQKEALEKNGFVVLAIQAGTASPDQVKDWLGKTGATLTPGTIEGDPHDTLLSWGAKGMPWLVLTNARHMVVKEGLTVDEFLEDQK
jgi:hypothetical protein